MNMSIYIGRGGGGGGEGVNRKGSKRQGRWRCMHIEEKGIEEEKSGGRKTKKRSGREMTRRRRRRKRRSLIFSHCHCSTWQLWLSAPVSVGIRCHGDSGDSPRAASSPQYNLEPVTGAETQ